MRLIHFLFIPCRQQQSTCLNQLINGLSIFPNILNNAYNIKREKEIKCEEHDQHDLTDQK
ncbi:hypothetical protein T11_1874 [Trichinella zimbabwensis]|uniref:Uncharacterized protein n=1 Tax=Trichinella zimbabwensis TaxID=268475 RepID=A0A0V1GH05_9BILA|nr:hypothetical protein T11_1874 [Trichinella zimbabwensis]